jgi:hypothetical protein
MVVDHAGVLHERVCAGGSGAELIRLGPLNREAVAQLATDVLGVEADERGEPVAIPYMGGLA